MSNFKLTAISTFTLPARSYTLVVGRLDSGAIEVGQQFELVTRDGDRFAGTVAHIEIHHRDGEQTIGIEGEATEHVQEGATLEWTQEGK